MYIPILKNIKNFNLYKNFFVILFIMTVIGLWHGPNYTYIIFGALHGIGLGVNHIFRSYNIKINKILSWIITINFVNITFVFFRSENHQQAIHILKKMFYFKNYELIHISDLWSNLSYSYIFIMFISLVGITLKNTLSLRNEIKVNYLNSLTIVFFAVTTLFYLLSRFGFEDKFIYLQF